MNLSKYKQELTKRKKLSRKIYAICAISAFSFSLGFGLSQSVFPRTVEVVKEVEITISSHTKEEKIFHKVKLSEYVAVSDSELRAIIIAANKTKYPELIVSIAKHESDFKRHTRSHKGALGLTGIIPKWWHKELKEEGIVAHKGDYFLVENNVLACEFIIDRLLDTFDGDMNKALAFYNGGYNGMNSKQCKTYAKRVLEMSKRITV